MARLAATACGAQPDQALVLSTGVIGAFLPMDKIEQGISAAAVKLGNNQACLLSAARGMLTTDTVHKLAGRKVTIDGGRNSDHGHGKGAAMMGPNMATMLALIMTDAALGPATARPRCPTATSDSFNCISVDGHMSTNDTVLLLANGAAGGPPVAGKDLEIFQNALKRNLRRSGQIHPRRRRRRHALDYHRSIALRRSRFGHGPGQDRGQQPAGEDGHFRADPNWGRIVSAAGYAGVPFDPNGVSLRVNGFSLYEKGAPRSSMPTPCRVRSGIIAIH